MSQATPNRLKVSTITWFIIGGLLAGALVGLLIGFTIPTEPPAPKAATIIFDVHQKEVARLFVENRIPIPFERIPKTMKNAIIAVEDREFYKHGGINFRSIARAFLVDLQHREFSQGASTITQQLARNVLLTQQKTVGRKIKEIFIALNLERNFTKDEILEKYLNQIYFGHGAWGIESASELYFGKHINELKLHQYALLAGLPRGPGVYSPYLDRKAALFRRSQVLQAMTDTGYITQSEADKAKHKPLDIVPLQANKGHAAYFIDYILQQMKQQYGLSEEAIYTQGLQIYTTLDNDVQAAAENAVVKLAADKADALGVIQPQCALVAIDPKNGYIKAMIGGRDFRNTQLNRAVLAHRQPGSAIKPFVYTTAIDSEQFTPSTILEDEPISYANGWSPHNYDGKFRGPITLREALKNSVNIIAVKLVEQLGPSRVAAYAKRMGLTSLVTSGPSNDMNLASMALGGLTQGVTPLELASAYTPLANQGIYSEPLAILQVRDDHGNVLFENAPKKRVVLREETAYLMDDMMRGVIEEGTGQRAQIGRPAAGKTGTTSDYTNAWFVGFTPDLLAAVWIGNDSQRLPVKVNGVVLSSSAAAGIWGDFMRVALENTPPSDFVPPSNIVTGVEVCTLSGMLATPSCPDIRTESFIAGTEPKDVCNVHGSGATAEAETIALDICLDSGAIATPDCPRERVVHRTYWKLTGKEVRDGTPIPTQKCPIHSQNHLVTVRVCTESGLLATPYCPKDEVVTKDFQDGEQPTAYCNIHFKNQQ